MTMKNMWLNMWYRRWKPNRGYVVNLLEKQVYPINKHYRSYPVNEHTYDFLSCLDSSSDVSLGAIPKHCLLPALQPTNIANLRPLAGYVLRRPGLISDWIYCGDDWLCASYKSLCVLRIENEEVRCFPHRTKMSLCIDLNQPFCWT